MLKFSLSFSYSCCIGLLFRPVQPQENYDYTTLISKLCVLLSIMIIRMKNKIF